MKRPRYSSFIMRSEENFEDKSMPEFLLKAIYNCKKIGFKKKCVADFQSHSNKTGLTQFVSMSTVYLNFYFENCAMYSSSCLQHWISKIKFTSFRGYGVTCIKILFRSFLEENFMRIILISRPTLKKLYSSPEV